MLSLEMIPVIVYFFWNERNKVSPQRRLHRTHKIQKSLISIMSWSSKLLSLSLLLKSTRSIY